jgi:hypothetical protein
VGSANGSTRRRAALVAAAVAGPVVLVWLFIWWSRPPQMGADEEVSRTVDALFTAVTARDEKLLGQCEQRLRAARDAGTLPTGAADYLDGIIRKARAGRWESAAGRLYEFMRAQRREGPSDRGRKTKKNHPNAGRN